MKPLVEKDTGLSSGSLLIELDQDLNFEVLSSDEDTSVQLMAIACISSSSSSCTCSSSSSTCAITSEVL
ncbi:MAG: hypothetical protein ACK4GU_06660 [Alishewanella aestuarii]